MGCAEQIKHRYAITRLVPILLWIRDYRPPDVIRDLIAGFTIGLMVTPQCLAYANMAGLPVVYGLYSSFFGIMWYAVFGTSKDISVGPTAIVSVLTATFAARPESWPIPTDAAWQSGDQTSYVELCVFLALMSGDYFSLQIIKNCCP